jgi:hypothetical protein
MMIRLLVVSAICTAADGAASGGPNSTWPLVYIIRHGEKLSMLGCLNDRGHTRANNLPSVFNGRAAPAVREGVFQVPTHIFANLYDDPYDCERCVETATPISQELGLAIDQSHGFERWVGGGNQGAAAAVRATATKCHGTLQSACGGARRASVGNCFVCTGKHQHQLQVAGCDNADLQAYCANSARRPGTHLFGSDFGCGTPGAWSGPPAFATVC